jgi:hypothetical protein
VRVVDWRHAAKAMLIEALTLADAEDFLPAGVRHLSKSCRRRASCLAAEIAHLGQRACIAAFEFMLICEGDE